MSNLLHRGEGFGTIGIGVPYLKAGYDFFRWWSWLLVGGMEDGDELLNTADVPGEVPIPAAHNALVRAFLAGTRDTLCIVEDDHCGPQDVIRRMRLKPENWDFDIVCANYTNRRGMPKPMGWYLGDGNGRRLAAAQPAPDDPRGYQCIFDLAGVQETGTQEYDGAGLGLVLIRRWVLDDLLAQSGGDPDRCFWFRWIGHSSQDVDFYVRSRALGARTGVDRDAQIGHVGKYTWTFGDFTKWRNAPKEEA